MADFDVTPSAISAYLYSRNRTERWVKTHGPSNGPQFHSPSKPPSRIPSYISEPDDYFDDNASVHSIPPVMVLRYGDGRPDVPIPRHNGGQPGRGVHHTQTRARSASQPVPPGHAPSTPQFPEEIRILPAASTPGTSSRSNSSRSHPSPPNVSLSSSRSGSYQNVQAIPPHARPRSPGITHSHSDPLPASYNARHYTQPHASYRGGPSYPHPSAYRAQHPPVVHAPVPRPPPDFGASSRGNYPQGASRPSVPPRPHTSLAGHVPGTVSSEGSSIPPPHRTDSRTAFQYPYWGEQGKAGRGRPSAADMVREGPYGDHRGGRHRSHSRPRAMYPGPMEEDDDDEEEFVMRNKGGRRGRSGSFASTGTYYPGRETQAMNSSQSSSTKHSPPAHSQHTKRSHHLRNASTSQLPEPGSIKKPFLRRFFHLNWADGGSTVDTDMARLNKRLPLARRHTATGRTF